MNLSSETLRQLTHISMVVFALSLRWLSAPWAFLMAFSAFIHNVLLLPKYAPHLYRQGENLLQGIAVYPLMVALLILLFPDRLILAAGAWAILAFGDGFSTLVGKQYPIVPLPWNPVKSLGGMAAFVSFGGVGAFLVMLWFDPAFSVSHLLFIAFASSLVAAFYETLPLPWDDNMVVSLSAAGMCALTWSLNPMIADTSILAGTWGLALLTNILAAGVAWRWGLVSTTGALGGTLIGIAVFALGGIRLYLLLLLFFILANAATQFGYHEKEMMGLAQEKGGKRGARHALANCLFALLAAVLLGISDGIDPILRVFYCAALATALSDTVSSELGQVYGRNPFLPTSFRRVPPGTVGAVSIEGTLCGMGSCLVFALAAYGLSAVSGNQIPAVVIGGWLGFYGESYIAGVWTEEGVEVDNEWMNLLNTFLGGTLALLVAGITTAW